MLFSIIMCTHNSEATLAHALDSVRNQTFRDWELIVLDNGSRDATVEILKESQKLDERIVCLFRGDNVGWQKGISICLSHAAGEYMMFLGADDALFHDGTLEEVGREIEDYHPDIVWTGHALAALQNGAYEIKERKVPCRRRYEKEDKLTQLSELMSRVYYNSVMHYVRIDFLRENGIDFFSPFYGDCQGMTEAACRAGKMSVLDLEAYILTVNTSQTSQRTVFDYDIGRQWESLKETLPEISNFKKTDQTAFAADRVLQNLAAMTERILMGDTVCDLCMNDIQKNFAERFLKAEEWISSDAFGEMMYFGGRRKYTEWMLGAAGVLYWKCRNYAGIFEEIRKESRWLAEFAELVFIEKASGEIAWKEIFSKKEAESALLILQRDSDRHRIGAELLLREGIWFEDMQMREKIETCLQDYFGKFQKQG